MVSTAPQEFDIPLSTGAVLSDSPFEEIPASHVVDVGDLEGDPAIAFRRTMGMFATGVTVLTTIRDGQVHGMTANAFMSVSLNPPLVLVSIDRRAKMLSMLHEGSPLGVSVLAERQSMESNFFAGRPVEAYEPSFELIRDIPLVGGALAQVAGRVVRSYWGGDHSLFLVRVEAARYGEGKPLLFHGGRYERILQNEAVLAALPPELLTAITSRGVERTFAEGDVLMALGETSDEMMLVLEGQVLIERPDRRLELGPGAIVGEIEVLDPGKGRLATITAVTSVRCLVVTRDAFREALTEEPGAALALVEILASRFRDS